MDKVMALRNWVKERVYPFSNAWEEQQAMPPDILSEFAGQGWFGAFLPEEWGGSGLGSLALGQACAGVAYGSVSLLSILTVHSMLCQAVLRWGTDDQKRQWLPALAAGKQRGAFALTEPNNGSDAAGITCQARRTQNGFVLNGKKKWISGSMLADVFLVMARLDDEGPTAFLVPATTPGLERTPMRDLFGFRAAGIAELAFTDCALPEAAQIGPAGGGFSFVGSHALDCGRFIVGWGGVGIMEGCLEASTAYAMERNQFGVPLRKHQLIQEMVANMATSLAAARALAEKAASLRDAGSPDSIMAIATAKYFASRAGMRAASDALQIHGGNGCSPEYPLMRYFRDAKICEIIEGSSQMQQLMIANAAFMNSRRNRRHK